MTVLSTKLNCELYDMPYVNHGSANSDTERRGKSISRSLRSKYESLYAERATELAERIKRIVEKKPNEHMRALKRMQLMVLGPKCQKSTRSAAVEFCSRIRGLEHLDWELIETLSHVNFNDQSKKLILKKKCGDNYFRVPVMVGFERKIPPTLIGDIRNLRVIRKIDNIKKRMKLDRSIICHELFEGYL